MTDDERKKLPWADDEDYIIDRHAVDFADVIISLIENNQRADNPAAGEIKDPDARELKNSLVEFVLEFQKRVSTFAGVPAEDLTLEDLRKYIEVFNKIDECYLEEDERAKKAQAITIAKDVQEWPKFSFLKDILQNPDTIPKLQSTGIPKHYFSPNTTLTNALQALDGKGELIGAGPIGIQVIKPNTPKAVCIEVCATLENMDGVTITGKPFSEYDRAVHDAICSLYLDRVEKNIVPVITADIVYRTMTGKTDGEYVSPKAQAEVINSIDKMRQNIFVKAELENEIRAKGLTDENGNPVTLRRIKNFVLSADEEDWEAGGKIVKAYRIINPPILLRYAKMTKQLITVDIGRLEIKDKDGRAIRNDKTLIAIRGYLLRRIETMRRDEEQARDAFRKHEGRRKHNDSLPEKTLDDFRKQKRIILLESVLTAAEVKDRKAKARGKNSVFQILDSWQASGDIKGYEKRKKGKSFDAVTIEF